MERKSKTMVQFLGLANICAVQNTITIITVISLFVIYVSFFI